MSKSTAGGVGGSARGGRSGGGGAVGEDAASYRPGNTPGGPQVGPYDGKPSQRVPGKNPVAPSSVEVSTSEYLGANGKTPSGKANWAFVVGNELYWAGWGKKYSDAKKAAQKYAGEKGINKIYAAP